MRLDRGVFRPPPPPPPARAQHARTHRHTHTHTYTLTHTCICTHIHTHTVHTHTYIPCCVQPRGEPRIQFRALVSEPERLEDTCGLIANDAAEGQYEAGTQEGFVTQEGLASGDFGDSTYGAGGLER